MAHIGDKVIGDLATAEVRREIIDLIKARLIVNDEYYRGPSWKAPRTPMGAPQAVADELYAKKDQRSLLMGDGELFAYYQANSKRLGETMDALCRP